MTSARICIAPNCSLTPRGAGVFFGGICAVSFGIAGLLALQGFWPVLPFAGLEMALLAWALRASLARARDAQVIVVAEAEISIETPGRQGTPTVFPRHWAQVRLRPGSSPLGPTRLSIESHGRRCEIGTFLTEQERAGLARRLRTLVGRANESPPLTNAGSTADAS